ncbi:MAG: phosphate ABC transporter substrate-binding protein [Holophagaceae bacterium]|uniref:Phosphate-binding protein n=1 Tax=Candidatus Geothrix skivensis TaxID=2954439 RepID=A0A9D7SEC1_9BACT|nr:phosphate ABC transporter substrate-binding protein [Candidatus Geothrix skivensis]
MRIRFLAQTVLATLVGLTATAQTVKVDPKLTTYKKVSGVSGNLNSIGSDTLNNLMTYWVEGFNKHYPNVKIQVEGKGSTTAPPALIESTSQLGPMSREMKNEEMDKFEKKFGYKPTKVAVAIDALAVFVNKGNPIKALSMQQVDAIFSKTRKGGLARDLKTWGELGLTGEAASRPLSLYGRNSASGTYGYFKEHALFKGDFKDTVKEQPGSSSVVQSVGSDRYAIGYSGIGYLTSGVRAVPLSDDKKNGGAPFEATYENALSGKYPMARFLYVYINKDPKKPMDPLTREFLKFVLSKEGQEVVVKDGFLPLTAKMEIEEFAKLK